MSRCYGCSQENCDRLQKCGCSCHKTAQEPINIKTWTDRIINKAGGLKSYHKYELGGTRPTILQAAEWVLRCLANPRCEGSAQVLGAIHAQRTKKMNEDE